MGSFLPPHQLGFANMRNDVQGLSWLSEDKQREDMLQRWTIAFVRSTMAHVRENCDLRSQLTVRPTPPSFLSGEISFAPIPS